MEQQKCLGSTNEDIVASPMPVIGVYIAASTLVCLLFLVIDVWQGFSRSKLIFPTKFFSLNSLTLTLLGISTKLPVDLTSSMPSGVDQLSKLSGPVLITIAMGFCAPSLGDMEGFELLGNMISLTIPVVTVIVNVTIQMSTGVIFSFDFPEHVLTLSLMLLTLVALWYLAYVKNWLIGSHGEGWRVMRRMFGPKEPITTDFVLLLCKDSSFSAPQFRLCFYTNYMVYVGILCIISLGNLLEACVRTFFVKHLKFCSGDSEYKWSMWIVVVSQILTVVVGTFAITYRSAYKSCLYMGMGVRDSRVKRSRPKQKIEARPKQNIEEMAGRLSSRDRLVSFRAFKEVARSVPIKGIQYLPMEISTTCLLKLVQVLEELINYFFFGVYIIMGSADYAVKIFLVYITKGISCITRKNLDLNSLGQSMMSKASEETEIFLQKCKKDEPRSLIRLLQNTRPSQSSSLNEESNCCLLTVLLVRVASIMGPLGQSLVDALDEIFEILYFIDQQSESSGFLQNLNKRVTKELWMSRGLSDHWFQKKILSLLQKDCHPSQFDFSSLLTQHTLDTGCKRFSEIVNLGKFGQNSDEDTSDSLKQLFVDIMYFLLTQFPEIIAEYFRQCPVAELEQRSKTALKFVCKYEMLVHHVDWLSVGYHITQDVKKSSRIDNATSSTTYVPDTDNTDEILQLTAE